MLTKIIPFIDKMDVRQPKPSHSNQRMGQKRLPVIHLFLLAVIAIHPIFYSCGDKAIGADGTVIAEFEWNGKQRITLEEMQQEISELPEYKQRQYEDKEGLET